MINRKIMWMQTTAAYVNFHYLHNSFCKHKPLKACKLHAAAAVQHKGSQQSAKRHTAEAASSDRQARILALFVNLKHAK